MDFAQNLKVVMDSKSMTMYRLAKELGVHQTTIKNWLDGKGEPRISEAQAIADALGVHIFDLTGIGKELDKYVFELDESSLPPDISPSEKARIVDLFKSNPRDSYNRLLGEAKEDFWEFKRDCEYVEQIAQDYDNLDQWGKRTVRAVISAEQKRMRGTEGKDTPLPPPPPESP